MKLSVIIISYNEAQYLERAINSCLTQNTSFDFEIIIGDDGSNDKSIDIIKNYVNLYPSKIRYYVMDRTNVDSKEIIPSFRVSDNLKRALTMCNGEYISILSGDDYFCDIKKFQRQVDILDSNRTYIANYSNYKYVYPDEIEKYINIKKTSNSILWSGFYVHISCFIFRKKIFIEDKLLKNFCDDTGLMYSLLCNGKISKDNNTTFCYFQRHNSIMHDSDNLELYLVELLMFEDILTKKMGFYHSSISRFFKPMWVCFYNRKKIIDNQKFDKYLKKRDLNSIITNIIFFDSKPLLKRMKTIMFLSSSAVLYFYFKIIRYIINKI